MARKHFETGGIRVRTPRLIGIIYSSGKGGCTLAVVRPDVDVVGYKVHDRTPDGVIGLAKRDGLEVSGIHAIKDCPRWAQQRFVRLNGYQFNWPVFGWVVLKPKGDAETEAA